MADLPDVPQFSLPFRLCPDGEFAYNEQDTLDDIADCVQCIVRYPLGYLEERPAFGVPEQEFQQSGPDRAVIQAAIDRWEDRAEKIVTAELDDLVGRVRIEVEGGQA
jgi:phage baseplate assembly protein W